MTYHQFSREDYMPDADPPIVRRYCLHVKPDDEGPLPARCWLDHGHSSPLHDARVMGVKVGTAWTPMQAIRWPNDEPVFESGSLFEEGAA